MSKLKQVQREKTSFDSDPKYYEVTIDGISAEAFPVNFQKLTYDSCNKYIIYTCKYVCYSSFF